MRRGKAAQAALLGLLFAMSMALSFFESALLGVFPIPGVKPGLANIVTMFCLFCLGPREAYTLAGLRTLFILLTRAPTSAAISLAGGLLSVTAMLLLCRRKEKNPLFISVSGGIAHNVGQLFMAAAVMQSGMVFYYLPVLVFAGAGAGILTGMLLRYLGPYMERAFGGRTPGLSGGRKEFVFKERGGRPVPGSEEENRK